VIIQFCGDLYCSTEERICQEKYRQALFFFGKMCYNTEKTSKTGGYMGICYIVGAGDCQEIIRPAKGDLLIAADGGADHLARMGLVPDLLLGDLDSLSGQAPSCPLVRYPAEKDDTDMALAVEEGVARGYREFLIFGVLGGERLDHTLAAVSLLPGYVARGLSVTLLGGGQRVCALSAGQEMRFPCEARGYLSLLAVGADVTVSAENLKYPLQDDVLPVHATLGISNEFLPGRAARVFVKNGCLLLVWQEPWKENDV
jgi:thiamine pyrophosphokinase